MTARDESASFRIFSTLNSRGVDLSEVDKLKADLLQVRMRGDVLWGQARMGEGEGASGGRRHVHLPQARMWGGHVGAGKDRTAAMQTLRVEGMQYRGV